MPTSPTGYTLPISEGRRIALHGIGSPPDAGMVTSFWREVGGSSAPETPGITVFYCILQVGEQKYTLLEFVSGQTLEQLCTACDPSECEHIVPMFSRLLDGYENLPDKRRRKRRWPRRAAIPGDANIQISDFGIVRASGVSSGKLFGTVMFGPDGSWSEENLGGGAGRGTVYPVLMAVYTELRGGMPAGTALHPAHLDAFTRRSLLPPTAADLAQMVQRRALPYAIALGATLLLMLAFTWIGPFLAKKAPTGAPNGPAAPGIVKLEIHIAEDGSVRLSRVLDGDARLTNGAVEAVNKWTYKPAEINGKPVPATAVVDVRPEPDAVR